MNKWITHVKKYAKKHNIGYNEALRSKKCQMEYRKTSPRGRKTSPRGRKTSPRGRKKMNGVLDKLLGRRKGKNTDEEKLTKQQKKGKTRAEIAQMERNLKTYGYPDTDEGMMKRAQKMAEEESSKITDEELEADLAALMNDQTI